jgi:hypothetical protein
MAVPMREKAKLARSGCSHTGKGKTGQKWLFPRGKRQNWPEVVVPTREKAELARNDQSHPGKREIAPGWAFPLQNVGILARRGNLIQRERLS